MTMARPRQTGAKTTTRKTAAKPRSATKGAETAHARTKRSARAAAASFTCPECGRTFTRAAALGAHRRSHGVRGSSTASRNNRARRNASGRAATPQRRQNTTNGRRGVNRDALLSALFPQGIPPREEVVREVNAWLDDAERLARLR
jgi:hypothetical protein